MRLMRPEGEDCADHFRTVRLSPASSAVLRAVTLVPAAVALAAALVVPLALVAVNSMSQMFVPDILFRHSSGAISY